MVDLAGIQYRLIACDIFYLFGGIVILIASKFWNAGKIKKKYLYSGLFCSLVGIVTIVFHALVLINPTIVNCTGTLLESRRTSRSAPPWPVTWQYVFTVDDRKIVLELDKFSEESIFPEEGLEENKTYRIAYEDQTDIIVWIGSAE